MITTEDRIVFKKAILPRTSDDGRQMCPTALVTLLIPKGTLFNPPQEKSKCRAERATVLRIEKIENGKVTKEIKSAHSYHQWAQYGKNRLDRPWYTKGKKLFVRDFSCTSEACAEGIHFFETSELALNYKFN